jgi:hypothetical protein
LDFFFTDVLLKWGSFFFHFDIFGAVVLAFSGLFTGLRSGGCILLLGFLFLRSGFLSVKNLHSFVDQASEVALDLLVSLGEINMLGTCSYLLINFVKISGSLLELSGDVIPLFLSQVSILFLLQEVLENGELLVKNSLLDFETTELPVIGVEFMEPSSCNNGVSNIC